MSKKQDNKVIELHPNYIGQYRADLARERNAIGKKIGEARRNCKLTQGELTDRLGQYGVYVKQPAVNKWECGENIPSAYQLVALCHALQIENGLEFFVGQLSPIHDVLNDEGLRMLNNYRDFLEHTPRYVRKNEVSMVSMKVSLLPASAGFGDFLDDEQYEMVEFPASSVPIGSDFAVHVDGDSMEPLYLNGQLVWVQRCSQILPGEVGLFVVDGEGYIKTYNERKPSDDELDAYVDSNGVLHPQIELISYNKKYAPKIITPESDFRVIGRILK